VRGDILRQRLASSKSIERVEEFVSIDQHVTAFQESRATDLLSILSHAAGAILEQQDIQNSPSVSQELQARLSFPWICQLPAPWTSKRLVLVDCRPEVIMEKWLTAAFNLGIRITIVGPHGRWLQHQGFCQSVEKYIDIDMELDGLADRIADALIKDGTAYDGITTFTDTYFIDVAKAAIRLGLPTAPLSAVEIAVDKYKTRSLFPGDCKSFQVNSSTELRQSILDGLIIAYPLIVKPSQGWASEGVSKVTNEAELFAAVAALEPAKTGTHIVIETYLDGPEVDANFVLQDGKILFYELVDDFPCTSERDDLPGQGNFLETEMLYPSILPPDESYIIRDELRAILVKLGFHTGVFHLEARITNSSMAYTSVNKGVDLRPHGKQVPRSPTVTLLEINQRAPGIMAQHTTAFKSGVDWTALHLLAALKDTVRFTALAHEYAPEAQPTTAIVFINTEVPGVYNGECFAVDLKRRRPDLGSMVYQGGSYYRYTNPIAMAPNLVGHLLVSSDKGREYILAAAKELRREIRLPITPFRAGLE
jgi:biotin carboxylase